MGLPLFVKKKGLQNKSVPNKFVVSVKMPKGFWGSNVISSPDLLILQGLS